MKTKKVPFDIYIPASENRAAIKAATIEIEVVTEGSGQEMITPESSELIDKTQARYMGLLAGVDITTLRKRMGLTQSHFAELIGCGKKSLSRWENGHEYPSQLVNTLLRLLDDERVGIGDLVATRQPRIDECDKVVQFMQKRKDPPKTYDLPASASRQASQLEERIPA